MKNSNIALFLIGLTSLMVLGSKNVNAQHEKCATMSNWANHAAHDEDSEARMQAVEAQTQNWISQNVTRKTNAVITIPVVVHVVYNTAEQNISDAQIYSQIDALNEDFRLLNADSLLPSNPFWNYSADTEIEFCLATRDPNGQATTGITRTFTDSVSFSAMGYEKFSSTGGADNWEPTEYLNMWVVNFGPNNTTLGYAAFPSDLNWYPAEDGVVVRHEAFGTIGTAGTNGFGGNNLGRTATHEVGHWLNLRHIWGDQYCGDDFCSDTPVHEDANYGCPSFPHNTDNFCTPSSGPDGEMFMNYMDYPDDACLVMFTFDQKSRMLAALNGPRSGILSSMGCSAPIGLQEADLKEKLTVYPNPATGSINLSFTTGERMNMELRMYNALGDLVYSRSYEMVNSITENAIDVSHLSKGFYTLEIQTPNTKLTEKVILQ
jgi:hypothetical protein